MLPSNTYKVLGTSLHQSQVCVPHRQYVIDGYKLNELKALAMRLSFRFDNPDEKRDWQNLLNSLVTDATPLGE
jgi:hypothetical protein